jgi:hypothetical protein
MAEMTRTKFQSVNMKGVDDYQNKMDGQYGVGVRIESTGSIQGPAVCLFKVMSVGNFLTSITFPIAVCCMN